jgi:hypothetical protein
VPHRFFNRNAYLRMGGQNIERRMPNGMSAKAGEWRRIGAQASCLWATGRLAWLRVFLDSQNARLPHSQDGCAPNISAFQKGQMGFNELQP